MKYFVLDACENGIARLIDEEENEQQLPREHLPAEAAEGDCLFWEEGKGWQVDAAETAARRRRLREKRMRLLK